MTKNPYPIQIKKRILFSLIYGLVWIIVLSSLVLIFSLISAFYVAISLGVLHAIGIIYNTLYLSSLKYSLDDKNLVLSGGIISRFEKILPYSRIQHVIVYENFWQRVLGLSSISIDTARENYSPSPSTGTLGRIRIITLPLIPDLNKDDTEKLKNYIISVVNKYKSVAGV